MLKKLIITYLTIVFLMPLYVHAEQQNYCYITGTITAIDEIIDDNYKPIGYYIYLDVEAIKDAKTNTVLYYCKNSPLAQINKYYLPSKLYNNQEIEKYAEVLLKVYYDNNTHKAVIEEYKYLGYNTTKKRIEIMMYVLGFLIALFIIIFFLAFIISARSE